MKDENIQNLAAQNADRWGIRGVGEGSFDKNSPTPVQKQFLDRLVQSERTLAHAVLSSGWGSDGAGEPLRDPLTGSEAVIVPPRNSRDVELVRYAVRNELIEDTNLDVLDMTQPDAPFYRNVGGQWLPLPLTGRINIGYPGSGPRTLADLLHWMLTGPKAGESAAYVGDRNLPFPDEFAKPGLERALSAEDIRDMLTRATARAEEEE